MRCRDIDTLLRITLWRAIIESLESNIKILNNQSPQGDFVKIARDFSHRADSVNHLRHQLKSLTTFTKSTSVDSLPHCYHKLMYIEILRRLLVSLQVYQKDVKGNGIIPGADDSHLQNRSPLSREVT